MRSYARLSLIPLVLAGLVFGAASTPAAAATGPNLAPNPSC